jgi:hypothetical protein
MPDELAVDNTEEEESQEQDSGKNADTVDMAGFIPGQYAPCDFSAEPYAQPNAEQKRVLRDLVILKSRTDVASRRFEVEQAWEARLFPRGYQHLLPRRGGGWSLPGENKVTGVMATSDSASLYATNIVGRDTDILCAAIAREVPKVNFFPKKPEDPSSMRAADAANEYKYIYEKNSNLRDLLMTAAMFYCSDDRVLFYTRHVRSAEMFGLDDEGNPRGAEITSVFGKLEHKVPMQAQEQGEMDAIQTFTELDIASARAKYSWMADKIKPGTPGIGEIELDMIARVNTRLALLGSYVTGDAMQRNVTEQMCWLRPAAFFDDTVSKEMRNSLLELYPMGALIVYCGQEYCFSRNEAMDDHLKVSHALPGIGQNRRALLSSEIPIQKRLNSWIDLGDAFIKRTVPRRWYAAGPFDIEAIQSQDNAPGKTGSFEPVPGQNVSELCFVEPTPTAQTFMPDFIQSFFGEVPASLSGAVDTLFGSTSGDDPGPTPVGTITIRRDQALARAGLAWNAAKAAFAVTARQAVIAAASCRPEGELISENIPDKGVVTVSSNDLKGDVLCYPEYDAAFPEDWSGREARFGAVVTRAANGSPFDQALIKIPKNIRVIADNMRMSGMSVPGDVSVKKQILEIEKLISSVPLPNPQLMEIQSHVDEMTASGKPVPPEVQQQVESIPRQVSSIPVATDASEDHSTEGQTCFEWMNGEEGQKYKNGTAEQQLAYENVHLHWQAHTEMAGKLTAPPPAQPPRLNIPFEKLPSSGKSQAVAKIGMNVAPKDFENKELTDTQHKIHEKVVPKLVPETYRKLSR